MLVVMVMFNNCTTRFTYIARSIVKVSDSTGLL